MCESSPSSWLSALSQCVTPLLYSIDTVCHNRQLMTAQRHTRSPLLHVFNFLLLLVVVVAYNYGVLFFSVYFVCHLGFGFW